MRSPPSSFVIPAFALAFIACTGEAESPYAGTTVRPGKAVDTLYVNNGGEPEFLDPARARDSGSLTLDFQMFEGLTTFHPDDTHPTQGVAERWEQSADGRVLRFHLRREARWSDGRPVTAGEFAYAWKRVLRPATAATMASVLYPVLNAEPQNLGRLKAARHALALREQPRDDAPESGRLSQGAVVRITGGSGAPKGWAQIERYARIPTYSPEPPGPEAPTPRGFVRDADLVEDDSAVGVRAADDHTLEVELERATPYFVDITSLPTLAPVRRDVIESCEQRGEGDRWTRPESMVTNGPYTLESWRFRYAITMKRNPHYWNFDKLQIHRIVWLEVESAFTAMSLYRSGELDLFGSNVSIPGPYLARVERKRDFSRFPTLGVYWYELNVRQPPLDDARVRRALGLAIDRKLLTDSLVKGAIPASHYVPDYTGFGYAAAAQAERAAEGAPLSGFDPERARALLREAGYAVELVDGEYRAVGFPPLEILYNGDGGHGDMAVAIQDMWRRHLGVRLVLRGEEWKVMLRDLHDGRFQVARYGWIADYNHPHTFLETFLSTSPENRTGWASPAFDEALRGAAATVDPVESMRRYRGAERLAVEGMAKIPLYFFTEPSLIKPYVKGYHGNPRNIILAQYLWIDPAFEQHEGSPPAYAPLELPPPGVIGAQR